MNLSQMAPDSPPDAARVQVMVLVNVIMNSITDASDTTNMPRERMAEIETLKMINDIALTGTSRDKYANVEFLEDQMSVIAWHLNEFHDAVMRGEEPAFTLKLLAGALFAAQTASKNGRSYTLTTYADEMLTQASAVS